MMTEININQHCFVNIDFVMVFKHNGQLLNLHQLFVGRFVCLFCDLFFFKTWLFQVLVHYSLNNDMVGSGILYAQRTVV